MSEGMKYPADLREQAGEDDEVFRQLMAEYGYMIARSSPDRALRKELGIGPGYRLPPE